MLIESLSSLGSILIKRDSDISSIFDSSINSSSIQSLNETQRLNLNLYFLNGKRRFTTKPTTRFF
ncbi:hypothetical protein PPL_10914 [Heterostelium album PN500]|uniref:Uncharacterized protein n=1 Tax=Heterostelium pallidum (strain ATCC 26659 / Pp 5 / PN500) TaxID=670386 RepID=D3BSE7_HETP5|nr:hypothetical protein PPL_10914 [Heterostelium album PN500]EFA75653.1 hypothetical protein PPL_10914 [Heterostelium album PN500]|eukprot:XP_020427787.1 hypothetical protein PPL_10914 [Heterostelium album PN500]